MHVTLRLMLMFRAVRTENLQFNKFWIKWPMINSIHANVLPIRCILRRRKKSVKWIEYIRTVEYALARVFAKLRDDDDRKKCHERSIVCIEYLQVSAFDRNCPAKSSRIFKVLIVCKKHDSWQSNCLLIFSSKSTHFTHSARLTWLIVSLDLIAKTAHSWFFQNLNCIQRTNSV